jgi:hypothetical protein
MQTTIETDEKQARAEARKQLREDAKRQKKIEEAKARPRLESLTITIEWKRSRVWGYNPHATGEAITTEGRRVVGNSKAGGYGYCKRSTVIGDLFNQFLRYKLFEELTPIKSYRNGEETTIPYGIALPKKGDKWLPCFEGGIGESCYQNISKAIGGKWESIANTKSVEVYRWTAVQS